MFEKAKKHSVKIFVFTINILLAAIAILIIREKDQSRLLENAQKKIPASGDAQSSPSLPSFENSVSTENLGGDSNQADVSEPSPADNSAIVPPVPIPTPIPAPVPAPKSASTPAPAVSAPANSTSNTSTPVAVPVPTTKPSNTKTKTS